VRALNHHLAFLFTVLAAATLVRAQQAPDLDQIVSRMEDARIRSKQTEPFLLTREYRLFRGDEPKPQSEVKAEINVVPPHERDYKIVASKGSDRGEKVVRKILDHESQAEKSSVPPTALVKDNYDFGFEGEQSFQGARCYVLSLHPKRKDPSLIEGRAWVDSGTFLVRKVEGAMSKSPSWWVKDVMVTVLFGDISGVWTQTATSAVANVRIVGKYTVSGRATNLQTATASATNKPQKKMPVRTRSGVPAGILSPSVMVTR
jgi:hypothetical protein